MVCPVDHHFHSDFISPAYTGPVFHCLPLSPFHPSSVLLTSVGSTFVIPFCFLTLPLPYASPPTPLYLSHKTPPILTHWKFSRGGAQPSHSLMRRLRPHAPTHHYASTEIPDFTLTVVMVPSFRCQHLVGASPFHPPAIPFLSGPPFRLSHIISIPSLSPPCLPPICPLYPSLGS